MTQPAATPIRSMTGYGAGTRAAGGITVRMRLRSVNHRFLDLQLRLPPELEGAQAALERQLRGALRRGHVQLVAVVEREAGAAAQANTAMAKAYLAAWRHLAQELSLPAAPPEGLAWELLRLPGILAPAQEPEDAAALGELAQAVLVDCLAEHGRSREQEGAAMAADMRGRLQNVARSAAAIREMRASVEAAYLARLRERLQELLAGTGAVIPPERLAQEAALLAERGDISEELVRLEAHLAAFAAALDGGGEVGKKLDFLLQELNREANTLVSKTSGLAAAGLRVTGEGLAMKGEIEKIREQVQNIE